jgi:PAS domain S-box-containing protein
VVLTGQGSEQTARRALRFGADDYLTKPFQEDILVESLQLHLQRADLQKGLELQSHGSWRVGEAHLARLFFDAPAALVHADPTGDIRAVNKAATRMLARSPDELVGQPLWGIVSEEIRGRWLETVRREAPSSHGYHGEIHLQSAAGVFPASVIAVEGPESGHLILVLRDLTHQKAFEKRYFESKRLASLGRVVEGVAHEVRNPLISIGGFARKLRRGFDEKSQQGDYLEVILAEVERLERMVRDIEEFVQFSSQRRPRFAPLDLKDVLAASLEEVAKRNSEVGVSVRFHAPDDLPRIYADSALLRELFSGLVENAFDAMPSGGELTLGIRAVNNWIHLRVEDTGVGIPHEDLEEIFDPFFTSKTSGAGLGLAKAYLIVEEHSGTIDFESLVGKGTACTVSLPVERRRVPRGAT